MILTGIGRIGKDPELRYMPDGTAVLNLYLAYNYGQKGQDGKRPTQWVDVALYGKRAEGLHPHLTTGTAVDLVIEDPHIETYQKRADGGTGVKLSGRVLLLEFAGGSRTEQREPAAAAAPTPQPRTKPQPSGGFDDFEDDIPF